METKLPTIRFQFTSQVKRCLEDILYLYDEWYRNVSFYLIEKKIATEISTPSSSFKFWDYLERIGAVKIMHLLTIEELKKEKLNYAFLAIVRAHNNEQKPVQLFRVQGNEDLILKKIIEMSWRSTSNMGNFLVLKILDIKPIRELAECAKQDENIKRIGIDIADLIKVSKKTEESKTTKMNKEDESGHIKLPDNAKWQDITIRFIDNGDHVEISVKGKTIRTSNFVEMGFEDAKQKRPNLQWKLLQLLAMQKGELGWKTNLNISTKERTNIKKRKQKLSDTLKICFQIKESPFYSYKKEKEYKIKINLIGLSDYQESAQQYENDIDPEVKKYLNEKAPNVYDESNKDDDDY